MKKVWITGSNGQIGSALNKVLDIRNYEIINTDIDELDISDYEKVMNFGTINHPDIIINCANCKKNDKTAFKTNSIGTKNLSLLASKIKAKIVYLSNNFVFEDGLYTEFDNPNNTSFLAKSKIEGENFVKEFTQKHFIIRTCDIYGLNQENFVNFVINNIKNKKDFTASGGAPKILDFFSFI